jgi:hypothetical protein
LLEDLDQIERDIGRTGAGAFAIPSLRKLLEMQVCGLLDTLQTILYLRC